MHKLTTITTDLGEIQGLEFENGTKQFRGIRYATAERFAYPVAVDSWEGIYDATKFGNACPQFRTYDPEDKKDPKPFYYKEFREGVSFTYDEDCLFLNIYSPKDAKNAPVIIYIHGGAFQGGCGNELHMDGTAYAKKGVIFVTINYRLGVLGFLCDRKLTKEAGHSGNYGLYDQLEAIKWVHSHIASFGGNPNNITLFGQSAGAMSVQQHCFSPLTKPYFNKAYMASGAGIGREFANVNPVEDSYDYFAKITDKLGATPDEWRKVPVQDLIETFKANIDMNMMIHCCPHVDGIIIPQNPEKSLESKAFADIPYLLSTNSEDMAPEFLHDMSKEFCNAVNDNGGKAYYFYFSRQLPGDTSGAFHSAELWYTMGSLKKCWRPMTDEDYVLSDNLVNMICEFVNTGSISCNAYDMPQVSFQIQP